MKSVPGTPTELTERKHPRVRVALPVELRSGMVTAVGTTEDLSIGGMLLASPVKLESERDVWLRFNLPGGYSVRTRGSVVHRRPDGRVGLSFGELATGDHVALSEVVGGLLGYTRRGARKARRLHVTVRPVGATEAEQELAETMLISLHGGLLVTRAHFKLVERIWITWPERQRSASAKIVFRRVAGPGGLVELGFTFEDVENFWEL
ncbi:MAG TPA: PilZ domain-containing protein [Terriglobales bacterium]|nr:PilZ domain-containing protein [Terriglobales bacterium]